MPRIVLLLSLMLLTASDGSSAFGQAAPSNIDFNRDVKPMLSNICFKCHGPDPAERQGGGADGLRLDTAEGAIADLGGYAAVVPGQPDKSALFARITSTDPADIMPPPESGKKLTPREIDIFRQWIAEGAKYAGHWSYVKPARPPLPAVQDGASPRCGIDYFLLARLDREGLRPSPEADRYALIRRLSLDLTGLPPSLDEVDAFVADADADAYEKLVDRLLDRPSYGEHWARMWLDLARYADSAGYADDPARTIWLFRDYVIRSLNGNKPFDQFTIEQIAGDLLPDPSEEQIIATAFHRNTLTNSEGGTNDEEFRSVAVVDRVNTTMAVWMGATIACAQCHNHKFDPITQEEFFRFYAFFNNTDDADRRDESPLLSIYSPDQQRKRAAWQKELDALKPTLTVSTPELAAAQSRWEQTFPLEIHRQTLVPAAVKSQAAAVATIDEDGAVHVAAGAANDTYTIEALPAADAIRALQLDALPDESLPGKGPGHAGGNFVVTRIALAIDPPPGESGGAQQVIELAAALADYSQPTFDPADALNNKDPKKKGWAVGGQTGRPHTLTLIPRSPVEIKAGAKLTLTIEQASQFANHTLGHFRVSITNDARAAERARTPPAVIAALGVKAEERTAEQRQLATNHYLSIAPELKTARDRAAALTKQLADLKPATVPIMRELPANQRRKTRIQHRGNFLDLGQEVTEGTPAALAPLPSGAPLNRLTLARWLVDEQNPLTARVIANRYWEQLFGIGIVASSEEFGSQGDLPFHPELLDWLATELMRLQWDMKAFVKLLVSSAAYRQSSRVTPKLAALDPDNRLLARGPRFRLSAEMVRDQALTVAGLLSGKMYGPPVKPPQPSSGLNAAFGSAIDWQTSAAEDRYRRGLYTTWRRSNPYPSMAAFDAPNREVCTLRRDRTNTPLQALVTLNDPVYVEASQALARRMMAGGGSTAADRARYGFRLCVARAPREDELARLVALYQKALAQLTQTPTEAIKVATEPLGTPPAEMDITELAAWTVVGNVLLNMDETLMKR